MSSPKAIKTPKKLIRPQRKRLLAGVCAGFSDYTHIDVDLVRLFFIFLLLTGGAAIPLYIILWLLIPEK